MFPNPYLVYLHDTPSQALFDRAERTFSSGCVRVERALELAELVLDDPDRWNKDSIATRGRARPIAERDSEAKKIPVLLTYWTSWVDPQGRMNFRRDIYGQDAKWAQALDAGIQGSRTAAVLSGSCGHAAMRSRISDHACGPRTMGTMTGESPAWMRPTLLKPKRS